MKKLILSALAAMLCIGLTACGEATEESSEPTAATTAETAESSEPTATTTAETAAAASQTTAPDDEESLPETQETTTSVPELIEVAIDELNAEDAEMFSEYIEANGIEGGHFYKYNGEEIAEPVYFIPIQKFYEEATFNSDGKEYRVYAGDRQTLMLCPLDFADEYLQEDIVQDIRDAGLDNFVVIREWTEDERNNVLMNTITESSDKYYTAWTDEWFKYIDVYYIP